MKRLAGLRSWPSVLVAATVLIGAKAGLPSAPSCAPPPDDRAAGVIAAGTPAATPYYVRDSGVSGPTVVITAGLHGDEPAGVYAADQIRHWPIKRGKLVVLPHANVAALQADKRLTPGEKHGVNNLNRDFPKASEDGPARGALATALWGFVQQQRPAWLVDLHEGVDFSGRTNTSVGSSVIVFPSQEGRTAAAAMRAAVNATITNDSLHFTLRGPPVDGSLARAAGAHVGAHAMILETTVKGQPLSLRARQHRILVQALLKQLDMIDVSVVTPERMTACGPLQTPPLRVAVYDAGGTGGVGGRRVAEQVGKQLNASICRICGEDIRCGALGQFNVVVIPGGSGRQEAAALGEDGCARIRTFVEEGGGYIGICAGAYLATSGSFSWGLSILDAKTVSPKWRRGKGTVQLELTTEGHRILGVNQGLFDCLYDNGPCICPAHSEGLPDYEVLAFFRSELAENGTPPGIMINSPAIVAGRCGKGRVIFVSPHPEQTKRLETLIPRAVVWVSGQEGMEKK